MKLAIIGHRGVGKSSLALRLKEYYHKQKRSVFIFDLDQELTKRTGKTISQIFNEGESEFRELEQSTFEMLDREFGKNDLIIVTGAGFIPSTKFDFKFLWVRRPTDSIGRIFNDRPRLDPNISALDEYLSRYPIRETKYAHLADETLMLSEGFDFANHAEETYFTTGPKNLGGILTVFGRHLKNLPLEWGFDFFELRDDLLSEEQMCEVLEKVTADKIIYSFRAGKNFDLVKKYNLKFDWPHEFGRCEYSKEFISSFHIHESELEKVSTSDSHTKLAVTIESFKGLLACHEWQRQDPDKRSFLPISDQGIWKWYRLLQPQLLNFIRMDDGSALDQPTVLEVMRHKEIGHTKNFAAVLGHPVVHSHSPAEHYEFFKARHQPFFAIDVTRENFEEALEVLKKLGLKEAAVTSPLKDLAFQISQASRLEVQELGATNTLLLNENGQWIGDNTDIDGVRTIAKNISHFDQTSIAVWGGGGTLEVIKKVFANATYYSSRSGEPRGNSSNQTPRILIWAVSRSHFELSQKMPPPDWPIELVVDLNYTENSPGRECAQNYSCNYISGLEMFKAQARKQKEFWQRAK